MWKSLSHTRQGSPAEEGTSTLASPGWPCRGAVPIADLPEEAGCLLAGTGQSEEVWPSAVSVLSLGGAAAATATPGVVSGCGSWAGI